MARLADVPPADVAALLAGPGLALDFGQARALVRSHLPELAAVVQRVYGAFEHDAGVAFHDLAVTVQPVPGLRRYVAPQIEIVSDAEVLFEPFPAHLHLPLLEWGMNWQIAKRFFHCLLLHAGVVELGGRAVVMPALPGSGKSTLTAALALSGFRLLSDEFGVVDLADHRLYPMLRPTALKNESIDVIERFSTRAVIGPRFPGTRKGTVAHVAPDAASYGDRHVPARAALLLFPQFRAGAPVTIEPMAKARAFAKLAVNSFNYEALGRSGFDAVDDVVRHATVARLTYGDLHAACAAIRALLERAPAAKVATTP